MHQIKGTAKNSVIKMQCRRPSPTSGEFQVVQKREKKEGVKRKQTTGAHLNNQENAKTRLNRNISEMDVHLLNGIFKGKCEEVIYNIEFFYEMKYHPSTKTLF